MTVEVLLQKTRECCFSGRRPDFATRAVPPRVEGGFLLLFGSNGWLVVESTIPLCKCYALDYNVGVLSLSLSLLLCTTGVVSLARITNDGTTEQRR